MRADALISAVCQLWQANLATNGGKRTCSHLPISDTKCQHLPSPSTCHQPCCGPASTTCCGTSGGKAGRAKPKVVCRVLSSQPEAVCESVSASRAARGVEKESPSRSSFVQQGWVACEAAPRGGTSKQSLIGKCERTETSAVANTSLPFHLFLKANTYMYYICWLPFFSLPKTNLYFFQQSRIAVYVILAVLWAILTLRAWWWWVI